MKLNLGCGNLKLEGYTNIDISLSVNPDLVLDIRLGLPYEDYSIDEVNAGCVLEQLTQKEFLFVMNDMWRVLKTGSKLTGYVPSTDPRVLHLDPMDKLFFQVDSFKYFNKNENAWQQFGKTYGFQGWSQTKAEVNPHGIVFFEMIK